MSPYYHDSIPLYTNNFVSLAVLFVGLACLLILTRKRKLKKTTALDWIPGPRQYFLGSYLNLFELGDNKNTMPVMARWCARFGPIAKFGLGPLNVIALSSPHHIQKLYSSMDPAHLGKPHFVSAVLRPVSWAESLLNSTGEKWKSRRRLIGSFFKLGSLQSSVPAFNSGGRRLVERMQSLFESDSPESSPAAAPILPTLIDTTLATICKTTLGIDVDAEEGGSDSRRKFSTDAFLAGTKRFLEIVASRAIQPWLAFEPVFNLTAASKELHEFYQMSSKFLIKLTEELQGQQEEGGNKNKNNNNNKSLLRELIQAGLPNEGIYEESLLAIVAGYESSAMALHNLLFFLALHPPVQEKCHREVDQVFQSNDDDDDDDGDDDDVCNKGDNNSRHMITLGDLSKLEYLEQCLLESLRIVPVFSLLARELTGPLALDDDLELPSGTIVFVPLAAIHMNPQIYPEPHKFDPDRMAPERRKERHPYSYLPFSAGPRKCVAAKFATIEILTLAAHILQHFTVRTSDTFEEVVWLYNVSMQPETPIKFKFEKRE